MEKDKSCNNCETSYSKDENHGLDHWYGSLINTPTIIGGVLGGIIGGVGFSVVMFIITLINK